MGKEKALGVARGPKPGENPAIRSAATGRAKAGAEEGAVAYVGSLFALIGSFQSPARISESLTRLFG